MSKKIVLLLQGGGALGAFQCGAWRALQPFIREHGYQLVAIAGASIGALNAGMIARHLHDHDGGVGALDRLWTELAPTAPLPIFPFPGRYWHAWNGLLTGLLVGNPPFFRPAYPHWNPIGEMYRFRLPLYDTRNAELTLGRVFGRYRGNAPLLAIAATDVMTGEMMLFDSSRGRITAKMLAASIAIPILFSPIEIEGRHYWDGEIRTESLLHHVLARLWEVQPSSEKVDEYLVIAVDMFQAKSARLPCSALDAHYRIMNILLGNKLKHDQRALDVGNAYLNAMERLQELARTDPASPLAAAIESEFQIAKMEQPARIEVLHVGREPFEFEYISRDFDYSPHTIARLTKQGYDNASQALLSLKPGTSQDAPERQGARVLNIRTRAP
jgi:NTE family protein